MTWRAMTAQDHRRFSSLLAYFRREGVVPSYREMGTMWGIKSLGGVHREILALEASGVIYRMPARARAIGFTTHFIVDQQNLIPEAK